MCDHRGAASSDFFEEQVVGECNTPTLTATVKSLDSSP